ncbi:MAG: FG-GAP-like repeat-containing protein [Planctomycetota bacterium]|nr:FG-GAP-like repeat-containing protein [Planctomycetota bacterium]
MTMVTVIGVSLLIGGVSWGQTPIWLEWQTVSATNILADPSVGLADVEEKDFATADFDQDGDIDLVSVRKLPYTTFGNRTNVLFINVGGVMTDRTADLAPGMTIADNSRDVQVGDFDGNNYPDVIVANAGNDGSNGQQPRIYINLGVDALGNWLGLDEQPDRLPELLSSSGANPNSCAVAVGDLTGNGVDDIYLVDYNNSVEDRLLINDGSGNFTDQTAWMPGGFVDSGFATAGQIGDVNGDGWPDIVKNSVPAVRIAYNQGGSSFGFPQELVVSSCYHFNLGDIDGDGLTDVFAVQDPQDQFLLNTSAAGTIPVDWQNVPIGNSPLTGGFGGNTYIVDLDNDGDNDVVVTDVDTDVPSCSRRLSFLRNDGASPPLLEDPYPTGQWTAAHHSGTYDVAVADFNGDGTPDIWVGHCEGNDLYFQISNVPDVYPPTQLTCDQQLLDVEISWNPGEAYDSVEIRRDGILIAEVPGSQATYSDLAPSSGQHSYTLIAEVGTDDSPQVACIVNVSLVEPVLQLLCDQIEEDVQLQWQNQGAVTGDPYDLIRVVNNGIEIATIPGSNESFLDLVPDYGIAAYQIVPVALGAEAPPATCTLQILPTDVTDLVIGFTDDDNGSTDSVSAIMQGLEDNTIFALTVEIDDLTDLPSQGFLIGEFPRVWVEVGMYPNNHMITTEEGQALADYVLAGGQLYISGGDTFCFDPDTPIQDLVGFESCSDGGGSVGDISAIVSASCGQDNFDQVVPYDGEAAYVDQLQPVTTGEEILFASEGFTCAVINYVGVGGAVISQSPEMGGIGANHDRKELIERYISCLPVEPPVAQFSFDPAAGPAPLTVQFTSQSIGFVDDFLWQFGDAQESPSTSPQHVYSEAGSYTVTLTVTGPGGVDSMTVVDAIVVGEALPGFIRADANQDQALDIADAVFILTYLFGGGSDGGCQSAIDANDDGANNVADAVTVLDHLFSAGGPILPPFPLCGVDPSSDALECSNPACP